MATKCHKEAVLGYPSCLLCDIKVHNAFQNNYLKKIYSSVYLAGPTFVCLSILKYVCFSSQNYIKSLYKERKPAMEHQLKSGNLPGIIGTNVLYKLLWVYTKGQLSNWESIHKYLLPDNEDKLHAKNIKSIPSTAKSVCTASQVSSSWDYTLLIAFCSIKHNLLAKETSLLGILIRSKRSYPTLTQPIGSNRMQFK